MSDAKLKLFPIMVSGIGHKSWIPWSVLAPHEEWAQRNHSQSLQRLAERGGLSPDEAIAIIEHRRFYEMHPRDAGQQLAALAHSHALEEAARHIESTMYTKSTRDDLAAAIRALKAAPK